MPRDGPDYTPLQYLTSVCETFTLRWHHLFNCSEHGLWHIYCSIIECHPNHNIKTNARILVTQIHFYRFFCNHFNFKMNHPYPVIHPTLNSWVPFTLININKQRMTHTVSILMCYHNPAKEDADGGEQLQLHGGLVRVCPIRSITFTAPHCLPEFNMEQWESCSRKNTPNATKTALACMKKLQHPSPSGLCVSSTAVIVGPVVLLRLQPKCRYDYAQCSKLPLASCGYLLLTAGDSHADSWSTLTRSAHVTFPTMTCLSFSPHADESYLAMCSLSRGGAAPVCRYAEEQQQQQQQSFLLDWGQTIAPSVRSHSHAHTSASQEHVLIAQKHPEAGKFIPLSFFWSGRKVKSLEQRCNAH